jgi:hypothetical protein
MNKEARDLVANYIVDTLRNGVSGEAYEILSHIMKQDRELASSLYDVYESLERRDGVYFYGSSNELDEDEGYEQ